MWLPWEYALIVAAVLAVGGVVGRRRPRGWLRAAAPTMRESAIVFVLYAVWRLLGEVSVMGTGGAGGRGRWIWDVERWLHLPNELTMQRWTLHATWLVCFANAYYIVAHVAPLGIFLVWLFYRHRDRYVGWRNLLGFSSLACLLIQLVPVAPPRLYPELGFVDTGARYGPRVYDAVGTNLAGQLAAMPSMHVAWAVLIGVASWRASRSRWRWIGPAHALLTVFAVTVTAYHWLADGAVAVAVLAIGVLVGRRLRSLRSVVVLRRGDAPVASSELVDR